MPKPGRAALSELENKVMRGRLATGPGHGRTGSRRAGRQRHAQGFHGPHHPPPLGGKGLRHPTRPRAETYVYQPAVAQRNVAADGPRHHPAAVQRFGRGLATGHGRSRSRFARHAQTTGPADRVDAKSFSQRRNQNPAHDETFTQRDPWPITPRRSRGTSVGRCEHPGLAVGGLAAVVSRLFAGPQRQFSASRLDGCFVVHVADAGSRPAGAGRALAPGRRGLAPDPASRISRTHGNGTTNRFAGLAATVQSSVR